MTIVERRAALVWGVVTLASFSGAALPSGDAIARSLDAIHARGRLTVCANPDALPFSSKNGDRRGFQLELGEALAKELGVSLEVGWVVVPSQMGRVD